MLSAEPRKVFDNDCAHKAVLHIVYQILKGFTVVVRTRQTVVDVVLQIFKSMLDSIVGEHFPLVCYAVAVTLQIVLVGQSAIDRCCSYICSHLYLLCFANRIAFTMLKHYST